jgi:hypothetical protein
MKDGKCYQCQNAKGPGIVPHTCNPMTPEAEKIGSQIKS